MARPRKETVEYFSHDTDASDGRTLTILQSKFGNDGYAFWFKLLEMLGKAPGHYLVLEDEADWEFLVAKTHVSGAEMVRKLLETLVMLGAVDRELYESNVIWSDNFVDRLTDVYERRKADLPQKPSICTPKLPQEEVSASETGVSDPEMRQSKVEESKENNIKENESAKVSGEEITDDGGAGETWDKALVSLRDRVSKPNYRTWFEKTRGISRDDGRFVVGVPTTFAIDYLVNNQQSLIEKTLKEVTGESLHVGFLVVNGAKPP